MLTKWDENIGYGATCIGPKSNGNICKWSQAKGREVNDFLYYIAWIFYIWLGPTISGPEVVYKVDTYSVKHSSQCDIICDKLHHSQNFNSVQCVLFYILCLFNIFGGGPALLAFNGIMPLTQKKCQFHTSEVVLCISITLLLVEVEGYEEATELQPQRWGSKFGRLYFEQNLSHGHSE